MQLKSLNIISSLFLLLLTTNLSSKPISKYYGIFQEWQAYKSPSRPENIRIDKFNDNIIWVTLPKAHAIAQFDYKKQKFTHYIAGDPHRPDGLIIDSKGHLWFGQQSSGSLGEFNPKTKKLTHHYLPYKKANPAITSLCNKEHVWISDHANNKIIEFNPKKKIFTEIKAPVKNSWVVDPKADSKNRIWYSAHFTKRIGVIDSERKTITEYQSPNKAGLAFITLDLNENIWYTSWTGNQIGYLNPKTKQFVEYHFPNKYSYPQPGAITFDRLNNRIVISTKKMNTIILLNLEDDRFFHAFPIPTKESGQREGIEVDKKGIIWFTEFGKNKIARLEVRSNNKTKNDIKSNKITKESFLIATKKKVTNLKKEDIKKYKIRPKKY